MPGGSEGPPRAESAPSAPRTRKQTAAEAGALAETYSEILGGGASAGADASPSSKSREGGGPIA